MHHSRKPWSIPALFSCNAADELHIGRLQKRYRDFVALCARKEQECGIPCMIVASR
jgi:hypothetical protein